MSSTRFKLPTIGHVEDVYTVSSRENAVGCQLCKFPAEFPNDMDAQLKAVYAEAPDNTEMPEEGSCVCVVYQDTFCRGKVHSVKDGDVLVEHVDYGSFDTVPVAKVFPLKPEFCTHPQIAIQVRLQEDFGVALEENRTFYIARKVEELGHSNVIFVGEFKPLSSEQSQNTPETERTVVKAYEKQVTFSVPPFVLERRENVFVSSMNPGDPGSVGVQLCRIHEDVLNSLTERMNAVDVNGKQMRSVAKGDYVMVPWGESMFRAVVVDVKDGQAKVEHVDYGSEDTLSLDKLYKLSGEFCVEPAIAIQIKASAEQFELDQEYVIIIGEAVDSLGRLFTATQYDIEVPPSTEVAPTERLQEGVPPTEIPPAEVPSTEMPTTEVPPIGVPPTGPQIALNVGPVEEVYVYYTDESDVSGEMTKIAGVQMRKYDVNNIVQRMAERYQTGATVKKPSQPGDYVCVQFEETYCRSQVVNIVPDGVNVIHLDYGSHAVVPADHVYKLEGELCDLPQMSFQCVFRDGFAPATDVELKVKVGAHKLHLGIPLFDVTVETQIIPEPAKQTLPSLNMDSTETLYYVDKTDFSDGPLVSVQLSKFGTEELQTLNTDITYRYLKNPPKRTTVSVGEIVATPFEGGFYRGQICSIDSDIAEVYQIDFALIDRVSPAELYPLDECFCKAAPYAFLCKVPHEQLTLPEEFNARVGNVCMKLYGIPVYDIRVVQETDAAAVGCSLNGMAEPQMLVVEQCSQEEPLTCNDFSGGITGQMDIRPPTPTDALNTIESETCQDPHSSSPTKPLTVNGCLEKTVDIGPLDPDEIQEVYCTVVGPDRWGFQLCRFDEGDLRDLNERVSQFYRKNDNYASRIVVGDYVPAPCDGEFFRALVTNVDEGRVTVEHIDYGSSEVLMGKLHRLDVTFLQHCRFAISAPKTFDVVVDTAYHVFIDKNLNGYTVRQAPTPPTNSEEPVVKEVANPPTESLPVNGTGDSSASNNVPQCSSSIEVRSAAVREQEVDTMTNMRDKISGSGMGTLRVMTSEEDEERLGFRERTITEEMTFKVVVSWLLSPTKLGVVREDDQQTLAELSKKLLSFSTVLQPIDASDIYYGYLVVVHLQQRQSYHRAKLLAFDDDSNLYKVYLVDSCEVTYAPFEVLFQVPSEFLETPQLGLIFKLQADDYGDGISCHPRNVIPLFDGVFDCRIVRVCGDVEVFGEKCFHSILINDSGDVTVQLKIAGFATDYMQVYPPNPVALVKETTYFDVTVIRVEDGVVTCILRNLQGRSEPLLQQVKVATLQQVFSIRDGTPALVEIGGVWKRASIQGRPSPAMYKIRLVDDGLVVLHPVLKTFKCPLGLVASNAEASVDVKLCQMYNQEVLIEVVEDKNLVLAVRRELTTGVTGGLFDYEGNDVLISVPLADQ